ncbi:MAG: zinc ribbon domain-containing protein [Gemmatimonadota bacterium]
MSRATVCPACETPLKPGEQTCQKCGKPLPYDFDETGVVCTVCGAEITAYTETCPACGETGYPALRPRKGKGFKGSPAREAERE